QALANAGRLVFLIEHDLADLVRWQFLRSAQIFVVQGCPDVTGGEQREDGAVDGVAGPPELWCSKPLLQVRTLGATWADRDKHLFAHHVRRRLTVMPHGVKRIRSTVTSLGDDLRPAGVIG